MNKELGMGQGEKGERKGEMVRRGRRKGERNRNKNRRGYLPYRK
jgi:hypothetical protein